MVSTNCSDNDMDTSVHHRLPCHAVLLRADRYSEWTSLSTASLAVLLVSTGRSHGGHRHIYTLEQSRFKYAVRITQTIS